MEDALLFPLFYFKPLTVFCFGWQWHYFSSPMAEANLQAVYQFPNYPYTCQNRPGLRMCFSVGIASGVWGPLDTALVLGWGIDSALSPPPDMDFISYYIALESDRHSLITVTMFYYCGVLLLIVFFPASKSFSRCKRTLCRKKKVFATKCYF